MHTINELQPFPFWWQLGLCIEVWYPPPFFSFLVSLKKRVIFFSSEWSATCLAEYLRAWLPAPVQSGSRRPRLRILFFLRLLPRGIMDSSISSAKVFTRNFGDSFTFCAHFQIYIPFYTFFSNLTSEGRIRIYMHTRMHSVHLLPKPWLTPFLGKVIWNVLLALPTLGEKKKEVQQKPFVLTSLPRPEVT